ncbi:alcohol dehydrogenase catalytic domain-containing protein [Novosphingobium sp. FSY-8]|uniref:Alcohol dehydrogenase catalytic domain-containing protein n=1 Tax=Novosphingobium ovatum TaxID=1908523 RepID=A0ABW9XDP1_9SPHN|nr:L-idonate 5-dehydrogenase [Novosphingobium ovatum]NBC36635.1 alcohol dehydrogenase catalytic domain-containing protein [Novosphingobium ovatum]
MRAVVCHGRHDLRVEPVETTPLAADQVRVAVAFGGICGSDMHYFHRGAVGDFAVRQPLVLGHEISGVVAEVGAAATHLRPGMKAALDPSRPCLTCAYCREGRMNLCADMWFLGSAGRFPHSQGGFSQALTLRMDQIIPVPDDTDLLELSVAEPLSVGLHAVNRAGNLLGKRVIVTGSGPIGLLTARSAALAGAAQVVCTDIEDAPLAIARAHMGATDTVNVARDAARFDDWAAAGGHFDVAFEASGTHAALNSLFPILRKGGKIVQVGMCPPGPAPIPINMLQAREIELLGAFRANGEFRDAVEAIVTRRIDVRPILSGTFPIARAEDAFHQAGDRSRVIKLHIAIQDGAIQEEPTA